MENEDFISKSYINNEHEREKRLYTITKAGISKVGYEFCIKRDQTYPYNNIHIVKKGSGIVEYYNKKYTVSEGQLFILDAFNPHIYSANSSQGMELMWIEFSGGDSAVFAKTILQNASPVFAPPNILKISKYINRIINLLLSDSEKIEENNEDKNKNKKKYLVSKIIYSLLISLFEFSKDNIKNEMPVSEHSTIKNIINFIDLNLGENLEVERLAKVTHFNVDYFSKMFKKVTGESPAKHVSKRRIIKSKELLCEDVVQIDEIAYRLGFCDSSHFIKAFKKAEGLTPAEFRRQSMLYKL